MKSISEVAKCGAMPDAYYLQSPGRKSTLLFEEGCESALQLHSQFICMIEL